MTVEQRLESRFREAGIVHFKAREALVLGYSNSSGKCQGKNRIPTTNEILTNLTAVFAVWDEVRKRVGKPIKCLSAYRSPEYNACVGGASRSQHLTGKAADCTGYNTKARVLYDTALALRREGFFKGGIGYYPSSNFVHIDVRGSNATWTGS